MISDPLLRLVQLQAKLAGGLSLQMIQMLLKLWNPFREWTDYDLGIAQAARSATTVEAAMKAARQRERAYIKQVYKELKLQMPTDEEITTDGGRIIIPGGVEIYLREGVTPLEVYQRPLEEFRYWKSTGVDDRTAMEKMSQRVSTISDTDLTLARRQEIKQIFNNTPQVTGYRRIIHPELSEDGTSCGLCVVASTRWYSKGELMPIHDECNCSVLPITVDADPGRELNQDDLNNLYDAAGNNTSEALLKTKVSFTEHGELGPIISTGNRSGSKQRKAARDRTPLTPEESIDKELHTLRKSAEKLASRASKGEDVRQYLNWQRDRISILERRLTAIRRNK